MRAIERRVPRWLSALALLAGGAAATPVQAPWNGPLPPHAPFFAFESRAKVIAGHRTKSARFLLLDEGWQRRAFTGAAALPAEATSPDLDTKDWPWATVPMQDVAESTDGSRAILRRRVDLPPGWVGQTVILHLGAAGGGYRIWINGHPLGRSADPRLAGEFDVTRALRPGGNLVAIEVTCNGRPCIPGLTREAFLTAVPALRVQDVAVTADWNRRQTAGQLAVTVTATPGAAVRAGIALLDGDRIVIARSARIAAGAGARGVTLHASLPGARPWSAGSPALYMLLVELHDAAGTLLQSSYSRIGFRTLTRNGDGLALNGEPLHLHEVPRDLATLPSTAIPLRPALDAFVQGLKAQGFNALRTWEGPADPLLYEAADRIGLYVMDVAAPAPGLAKTAMHRMVVRDRNHPSILLWARTPGAGVPTEHDAALALAHATDPRRPIACGGWRPLPAARGGCDTTGKE